MLNNKKELNELMNYEKIFRKTSKGKGNIT